MIARIDADIKSAAVLLKGLKDFLENVPPGVEAMINGADFTARENQHVKGGRDVLVKPPSLTLFCGDPACDGPKFFDLLSTGAQHQFFPPTSAYVFWHYRCRHCLKSVKTFAVRLDIATYTVNIFKIGEQPPFGAPLSARMLGVAGADIAVLKKGRQCENHGLGIGAFAYYRRVVEFQKVRLIDEIETALKRLGTGDAALKALAEARKETQFSKAIETIAAVLPKELFLNDRNPLTLLHTPLSVGLHGLSDEECLSHAHNIRIVMTAMLERIAALTEDSAELDAAIKSLTAKPQDSGS